MGDRGSPLQHVRTLHDIEFEDIQKEIDDNPNIDNATHYIVLPYWEYYKPPSKP